MELERERQSPPAAKAGSFALPSIAIAGVFLLVAALPFAAFFNLVLFDFYRNGSFLLDAGLFAHLMWHSDLLLHLPRAAGGESYFAIHVSPVLILISALSWVLPLTKIQVFAAFVGLCHALLALAVTWQVMRSSVTTLSRVIAAAALGILFAFDGLAIANARYPHIEMLIAATAILFLIALAERRMVAASLLLALCLATREDAGFQVFALLAVFLALEWRRGASWRARRPEAIFAASAFAYSVIALAVQAAFFPGHSSFVAVYLGTPPFAQVSIGSIGTRLLFYAFYRTYVMLPALLVVAWAIVSRNPSVAAGYVAYVPWLLLHLVAAKEIAGTLSSYYAYPFVIASFWPLLACRTERQPLSGRALAFFAVTLLASFTALDRQHDPGRIPVPKSFWSAPSLSRQHRTDDALAGLARAPELGTVLVDGSVLALVPDLFAPNQSVSSPDASASDSIVFFADGYESDLARKAAARLGLTHRYVIPGTSIRIFSDRAIDGVDGAAAEK